MKAQKNILSEVYPAQVRDRFICQYCFQDGLASPENLRNSTVDHFMPKKYGGTDDLDNLVTSCRYCNSLKHDKKFDSIEDVKEFIKIRLIEDTEYIIRLKEAFQ